MKQRIYNQHQVQLSLPPNWGR